MKDRLLLRAGHLVGLGRVLAVPVGTAAATGLSVAPILSDYRVAGRLPFVLAAAVGSVAVTFVVAGWLRRPPAYSYPASVAGLAVVLLTGAGPHPAGVVRALAQGPNRLLTETLPLSGSRQSVAALVVLTWVCGAVTSELFLRVGRVGRGAAPIGMAVPVGVFVLAYAVSASAPARNRLLGPLLLIDLVGLALLRHHENESRVQLVSTPGYGDPGGDERSALMRPVLVGGVVGVAVTVVASVVAPALPSMSHRPASLHETAVVESKLVIDPVDAMGAFRDGNPTAPATPVLRIDLAQPSTGYLAVAVLDDYDGSVWRFSGPFQPTGGRIPALPGSSGLVGQSTVVQHVEIEGAMPVPLLPAMDRATSLRGLAVAADTSGLLLPDGPSSGTTTYTVTSRSPAAGLATLTPADGMGTTGASIGSVITSADLTLPTGTTSALGTTMKFVASLTGSVRPAATVGYLQTLLAALHAKERRINPTLAPAQSQEKEVPGRAPHSSTTTVPAPTSVGGTSLSEVINAITVNQAATPEQFATLFALVARYLGVPARVVTGFRLASSSAGGPVDPGTYQLTNRDAWTWVEIPVAGVGWVVADPTPDASTGVAAPPPEQAQSSATTLPPAQANAVPRAEIGGHALAKRSSVSTPSHSGLAAWLVALLALAGLAMFVLAVGPGLACARRLWRRRLRRSPDPASLAVGAWLELLDALNRAGMDTPVGSTSAEIAVGAGAHFGHDLVDPVTQVGVVADQALCSVSQPPDASTAAAAWATQRRLAGLLLSGLDRRQRTRALVAVGSTPRRPERPSGR